MVHYSEAALYNKFFRGGWIDLCDNDCKQLVYKDVQTGKPCNATGIDADVLHKDTCDFIKDMTEAAHSFNWYPNLAIDKYLNAVFDSLFEAKENFEFARLIESVEMLRDKIGEQRTINEEIRKKWNEKKRKKLEAKRLRDEHEARQRDQQSQYDTLIRDPEFRKRWHIDPWPTIE